MKRLLRDLRGLFDYHYKFLTSNASLATHLDSTNTSFIIGLVVIIACFGVSTTIMYLGMVMSMQGTPPLPQFVLGLIFTCLYYIGLAPTVVAIVILLAVIISELAYLMLLLPLVVGRCVKSLLLGSSKR